MQPDLRLLQTKTVMTFICKSNLKLSLAAVWPLTFTARHSVVPHHVAVLQDARDGLRAVRLDEPLLAQEGDGTAQLEVLAETLPVHWHAWVGALIVTEGCIRTNATEAKGTVSNVC